MITREHRVMSIRGLSEVGVGRCGTEALCWSVTGLRAASTLPHTERNSLCQEKCGRTSWAWQESISKTSGCSLTCCLFKQSLEDLKDTQSKERESVIVRMAAAIRCIHIIGYEAADFFLPHISTFYRLEEGAVNRLRRHRFKKFFLCVCSLC